MEQRVVILEKEVGDLKIKVAVHDSDINGIKSDISSIKDDTKWLRRAITGAIITATATAVIGGIVGLIIWILKGGGV